MSDILLSRGQLYDVSSSCLCLQETASKSQNPTIQNDNLLVLAVIKKKIFLQLFYFNYETLNFLMKIIITFTSNIKSYDQFTSWTVCISHNAKNFEKVTNTNIIFPAIEGLWYENETK